MAVSLPLMVNCTLFAKNPDLSMEEAKVEVGTVKHV